MPFQTLKLEGINILNTSLEEVIYFFKDIFIREKFPLHIITFNLDFLLNISTNSEFRHICSSSDYVFPDGRGITNLLRNKYRIKVNRITGNELFEVLLNLANNENLKVAFIGSSKLVQRQLSNKIKSTFPDLTIAASISPPLFFETNFAENEKTVNKLIKCNPDIVFVALGSPRQELWISKIKEIIGAKLYIGVGSAFEYYTGKKMRAPVLLQRIGLEWFWRMLIEPKRLVKRYLFNDLPFFLKQIKKISLEQRKFR